MSRLYADYNLVIKDNISYTVDMLRLKTEMTVEQFSVIEFYINTFSSKYEILHYKSASISQFRDNYTVAFNEKSKVWFGFLHNSELSKQKTSSSQFTKYNFTIEFNPNKVDFNLLSFILKVTSNWTVKSVDFAMDLRINILDLFCFDKKRKRKTMILSERWR